MAEVTHAEAPKFDGSGGSFANYEEKVLLWKRAPAMEPEKMAAHLLLHMSDVARKESLSVGRDVIDNLDGAEQILRVPRERFAPEAIDSIFQDMAQFMYLERTGQKMDTCIMEFEMLREKAESPVLMGSGLPNAFISVLCMQNAALSKNGKTAVLASSGNALAFPQASAQMRRLF